MLRIIKLFFIGLAIAVLLVFTHNLGWLRPAESFLVWLASPFQRLAYSSVLGVKNFNQNWLSRRDWLAENQKLKEQLKDQQLIQAQADALQEENEFLKKELKFVDESQAKFVAAKIITGVSDELSRSVVINRGRSAGLSAGLAVVAEKGVMIGKISEVSDGFSKVLLLTDGRSKVAATIQGQDRTMGLVEGRFGLGLTMTNIPQNQAIKEGDLVVSSGLEGQIPKNLLLAQVVSVEQNSSAIFKTAVLSPIVPFDNLSQVLVIMP